MLILGYFLSSIMGLILGSIGAGGSILILPILVYFIGISPTLSTSYSLIIVGFTALIGSLTYIKKKKINFTIVLIFALPSLITVYLTRRYFLPILPNDINLLNILITKDFFIMILFSLLMIFSALLMINSKERSKLRSLAHHLKPVVTVGKSGLIDGTLKSINQALDSHELIKIKFNSSKDQKKTFHVLYWKF